MTIDTFLNRFKPIPNQIVDAVKHELRKSDENSYYYVLREAYATWGNPAVNQAISELRTEENT